MTPPTEDDEIAAAFAACSNAGRWGPEDELGTLNLVTPGKRRQAAGLVEQGVAVSLGRDLDPVQRPVNPRPVWHQMIHESERPYATADTLHAMPHGFAETHLDALTHMFHQGVGYNGCRQDVVVTNGGLTFASVHAQRDGIFTRAVLLDVAAARGEPWLSPDSVITRADLDAALDRVGEEIEPGDAVILHAGLERREAVEGREDPAVRAGLDLGAVRWLAERDVALYAGDAIEKLPSQYAELPLPLHQLALCAMGMPLLHNPSLTRLLSTAEQLGRQTFLLTVAPVRLRYGTGALVNPTALL